MAGFQNILQGGNATTSSRPKISDNSSIDIVSGVVGMAGQAIGSSYAESQAQSGYDNAFQKYRAAQGAMSGLEGQLSAANAKHGSKESPELHREISRLEDTIRRAKLGEGSGVLSGLAMVFSVSSWSPVLSVAPWLCPVSSGLSAPRP